MITKEDLKRLKPMLATTAEPFDDNNYLFEVKWDGFRCLSYLGESTVLQSRNNLDFTYKFPELAQLHRQGCQLPLILDGELVIMNNGVPSFYELQKRGWTRERGAIARAAAENPVVYIIFDILFAGERKLTGLPLEERKSILLESIVPDDRIYIPEGVSGQGLAFYQVCVDRGLEGVVAKKKDSIYMSGKRSPYWKKFKKALEADFVICGYKQTVSGSARLDALLLGCLAGAEFIFQGAVGVGLGGQAGGEVYKLVSPLKSNTPLFKVPGDIGRGLSWVTPRVCCTVQFLEPARDGGLRHPVFRGIRPDLLPVDCTGVAGALAPKSLSE